MNFVSDKPWKDHDPSVTPQLQRDFIIKAIQTQCSITNVTSFEVRPLNTKGEGFASNLFEAVVECTDKDKGHVSYNVVIKLAPANPFFAQMLSSNVQFRNETIVYNEIIPAFVSLQKSKGFHNIFTALPRCYYASYEPDNSVVMLENMTKLGYKMGCRQGLDYDHTKLALQEIAHYHATSVALKQLENEKFRQIIVKIEETMYVKEKRNMMSEDENMLPNLVASQVEAEAKEDGAELAAKIRNKLCNKPDFMEIMVVPEEPLAVLCHGDFCRNNVMFKYDDDNKPISIMLFDFQTPRYASPAIDLSFWFCVCTTPELREAHWEDLMGVYVKRLRTTISDLGADPTHFTKEAILEDYAKHAMYGYFIACYFLSSMLTEPKDMLDLNDMVNTPGKEEELEKAAANWTSQSPLYASRMVALTREYVKRGFL